MVDRSGTVPQNTVHLWRTSYTAERRTLDLYRHARKSNKPLQVIPLLSVGGSVCRSFRAMHKDEARKWTIVMQISRGRERKPNGSIVSSGQNFTQLVGIPFGKTTWSCTVIIRASAWSSDPRSRASIDRESRTPPEINESVTAARCNADLYMLAAYTIAA